MIILKEVNPKELTKAEFDLNSNMIILKANMYYTREMFKVHLNSNMIILKAFSPYSAVAMHCWDLNSNMIILKEIISFQTVINIII